jgi:hypothetical protein
MSGLIVAFNKFTSNQMRYCFEEGSFDAGIVRNAGHDKDVEPDVHSVVSRSAFSEAKVEKGD